MFGMEYETRVPIAIDHGDDKWQPIGFDRGRRFRIDLDRKDNESILEFVLSPVNDHVGSIDAAIADFDVRFGAMSAAIQAFADAPAGSSFSDVCDSLGIDALDVAEEATVNDIDMAQAKLDGPIHYTVGFALPVVPRLIRDKLGDAGGDRPKKRAAQADTVGAASTTVASPGVDMGRMHGYIALLYMLVAAKFDGARSAARNLNKNRLEALCRVPMDVVYDDLPAAEQAWLTTNRDPIIRAIQATYNPQPPPGTAAARTWRANTWGTGHKKDAELMPALVKPLFDGAFRIGSRRTDLVKMFGEMTVILQAEPVGQPSQNGYALELRRLGAGRGDPLQARNAAVDFIRYDRLVHGTPDNAPAPIVVPTGAVDVTTSSASDAQDAPTDATVTTDKETKTKT